MEGLAPLVELPFQLLLELGELLHQFFDFAVHDRLRVMMTSSTANRRWMRCGRLVAAGRFCCNGAMSENDMRWTPAEELDRPDESGDLVARLLGERP
ncbi:hypothetical protein JCM17961_14710 [Endothiovibrio diazotrophicus]